MKLIAVLAIVASFVGINCQEEPNIYRRYNRLGGGVRKQ